MKILGDPLSAMVL
ncbi:hypothetical protein A2U01_0098935 [Trifolium medium]|nr:hypothetical protein [Trifolium medium]